MDNTFDPNGAAIEGSGIFGLPYFEDESEIVLIHVPWEATVSCGGGCSYGPEAILEASMYTELFIPKFGSFYEKGIHMRPVNSRIEILNKKSKKLTRSIRKDPESNKPSLIKKRNAINALSKELYILVEQEVNSVLKSGKIPAVLGGEHSVSLGAISALNKKFPDMSVLQIDAHNDLRNNFEGFAHSHASVMRNVLSNTKVSNLVQVGIRAFCQEESEYIEQSEGRVVPFYDEDIYTKLFNNETWDSICDQIVSNLSEHVYISLDIDGMDPSMCPNTGTPVIGGLSFNQLQHLLAAINKSNKSIAGFDLVEVAPVSIRNKSYENDWNAICGARILYELCGSAIV